MQAENWLILTDYANKHRISISTLRRRIKAGDVDFRLRNGKYYLQDGALVPRADAAVEPTKSTVIDVSFSKAADLHWIESQMAATSSEDVPKPAAPVSVVQPAESASEASSKKLLAELKRAFSSVLHEKEEQIIRLKEEIADLRTLVRVLEDDNDRLNGRRPAFRV